MIITPRYWVSAVWLILVILGYQVPAPAAEDTLRLLVWEGYAPEPYREIFKEFIRKKYNREIKLEVSYVDGSESFYAPIRRKEVDLVTLTHHHFNDDRFNYITNGLILPLETTKIARYGDIIPALREAAYLRRNERVFGAPICQGLYTLVYNTAKVKPPPTSWQILWNPEYKGTYSLGAKEFLYNICTAALAMGYPPESFARFDVLNNKTFRQRLRSLAVNAGGFWLGSDKARYLAGKSLSAGWGDGLNALRRQGEEWRFAQPKEGSIYWVDSYAITWALADKPFLRKVAEEWINFLLGPDFQVEYIVREISQRPTTTTVQARLTGAEKKRLHLGDDDYFSKSCILLPTYSQRDRNGMKLLWSGAMEGIKIKPDVN